MEFEQIYDYIHSIDKGYGLSRTRIPTLGSLIESISFSSVLDVGAGQGQLLQWIESKFSVAVTGVEISQEAIKKAQYAPLQHGYAQDLKFDDDSFDIVICTHVLEHITPPDILKCLDEFRRVSSHWVLIEVDNGKSLEDRHLRNSAYAGQSLHVTRRPLEWWETRIVESGLNISRKRMTGDTRCAYLCTLGEPHPQRQLHFGLDEYPNYTSDEVKAELRRRKLKRRKLS